MVIACVTVISEPPGKLPIILRKPNAWQTGLNSSR
jgi:phage portal protein BeeE